MNLFDIVLIQPIFNILVAIYGIIPGHDFGLALILFTILVRLAMWPLLKKQLRQTKIMRQIQPELAKIKQRAKGNKQLESQLMLELYREKGINPFGSIGLLLVQLPIFIALFSVVRLITTDHANISKYTYDFVQNLPAVKEAIATHIHQSLFGLVDLTKQATEAGGGIYWQLLILAVVAAVLQYIQSKQLLPQPKEKRRLRDMLKDQANGKQVDQAEMSALMTGKMSWLFPFLTFLVGVYLQGALVLYLVTGSIVAIIQQHVILNQDEGELEKLSEKTQTKVKKAVEAQVVSEPTATKKTGKGSKKKKRS